ncbi:hypothetical protein GLOIN_2v1602276 [Rhizophagus irregularis DAOM 181602=DAOM 197198]|uniref:Uncharacterized protein n=1 Tax=Rhizophagus irregularis (strain DAOM 181602 / DAOM 197198 / MUCL 43194) TaxID=747089 RepID=A0A2P4Q294_RHIID|nr:hypothetical protein GLOIN_2v1602276 [Rhizophagus irregularis DAOM 181602=DAOM 197198]POG71748.1 hypothetical protein GLOIN_2v1602276 [Rhizophagus irregularis DAOM 181602=DAOM 197198]|eukprot:XP_025178614.1 hypothetical protein GLOIN_2v1602276 [Rhizophagus irregularis DAOM 181602=DAOM 197198]
MTITGEAALLRFAISILCKRIFVIFHRLRKKIKNPLKEILHIFPYKKFFQNVWVSLIIYRSFFL